MAIRNYLKLPLLFLSLILSLQVFFFSPQSFAINEPENSCPDCHSGQPAWPTAPNVFAYWFGSQAGQDGGHGDNGGRPGLTCTGTGGCHDMSAAILHNDGVLETVGNPSANTSHLQVSFIGTASSPASALAETFNTACAEGCHQTYNIGICMGRGHSNHWDEGGILYTPQFGYRLTPRDADGSSGSRAVSTWVDSDLSTLASRNDPDYAACVSCHDPHGTGVVESTTTNNHMVLDNWIDESILCISGYCHGATAPPPDLWSEAVVMGDGWRWLGWFGYFNINFDPWIYHNELGWLYAVGTSTSSIWLWDTAMNSFLWTTDTIFPNLYRDTDATWLFYGSGTAPYRYFYNYGTESWEIW